MPVVACIPDRMHRPPNGGGVFLWGFAMANTTEQRDRGVGKSTRPAHQPGTAGANPSRSLFYHVGHYDEARIMVERHHYSGRMASNVQTVVTAHEPGGLFGTVGDPIAACVFSLPPTRWSQPVWELSRLVALPGSDAPLTQLIAHACKAVRQARQVALVVSFADTGENHHGGVYQAAGWFYHGLRKPRLDGVYINGAFYPGRTANSMFGTQSPDKLRAMFPQREIEPHYDSGKHLYWKPMHRKGWRKAESLGLERREYPKPSK